MDLPDDFLHRVLSDNVQLSQCKPQELWKVGKHNKDGATSNWGAIEKARNFLTEVLDETGGKQLKQNRFARQVDK